MNPGSETVGHSRRPPLEDRSHHLLLAYSREQQIRKDSGDTGPIFPLLTSIPSAFAPLHVSVTSSSRSSPCPSVSGSGLRQETASGAREEWNATQPSHRAPAQPQGTENEARMNSSPSHAKPQSRWAPKEPEVVKPARRGQGRPRSSKSRGRKHGTDEEKAAAKLHRRARKYARREARAAEANEEREARAAEVDKEQRLWLEARWRRAGVTYKPAGTGAKSAPGQRLEIEPRRLPRQDVTEETDKDDWPNADETLSSARSENSEDEQRRMLQHELSDKEMIHESLGWTNSYEPMRIAPEQDWKDDESQHERAYDFYDLGNKLSLDLGQETDEEDWTNTIPTMLLPPGIATTIAEEAESGEPSL